MARQLQQTMTQERKRRRGGNITGLFEHSLSHDQVYKLKNLARWKGMPLYKFITAVLVAVIEQSPEYREKE